MIGTKALVFIPVFFQLVSATIGLPADQEIPQEVIPEVDIRQLLAVHNDDPIEVMRHVDPNYLFAADDFRLIEVPGTLEPTWMPEGIKLRLRRRGLPFIDLTGHDDLPTAPSNEDIKWPAIKHQEKVNSVIAGLEMDEMMYNLGNLTSFHHRYYRTEYGAQSARWIHSKVLEIIADAPPNVHVSLETFTHYEFPQTSVIARFEPTHGRFRRNRGGIINTPVVIIGTHLDSVNAEFPLFRAPGADDGGSGTVTILEAFRALVQAGFRPEVAVEFHWYAAEEGGLLGSQDIVAEYVYQGKNIEAMIQFDMTAYVHKDTTPTLTLLSDNVHTSLTSWAMKLAREYCSTPVAGAESFPGGVSDHISWHRAGVPVICATEADPVRTPNPYIHTVDDQMVVDEGEFSFEHALEFVKLAVGFAVELGGWND